ncbi:protein phosphatase 2C domain-containing protein [Streptomyces sp. NRRL S-646]|uniref:protein phosphatase 2C domain-containing protein n=1 Tax=Streptomyces sp. NRRL S-646 TaxID=1463917 RepID=UPI0004C7B5E0|nr:protein phosphatase 2C domain-containing protein [Streptomyces sp. NRRL S-646]
MTTSTSCVYVTHLVAPKHGSTEAECEDAVAVLPGRPHDYMLREPITAGVCDGATESALAKDWARLLSRAAAERAMELPDVVSGGTPFEEFASSAVAQWEPWLVQYTQTRHAEGRPLKWYEHTKLAEGAYATLLTVRVDPDPDSHADTMEPAWRWRAAALGDSCLFHLHDNRLVQAFPVAAVEEFGTTPHLFGSRNHDVALLARRTRFTEGRCRSGDRLLLMTDALAAWLMSAPDQEDAVSQLLEFAGPDDLDGFKDWLTGLRDCRQLRNDDVAFVRIDFEGR